MNKSEFVKFLSAFELSRSKITKILNALGDDLTIEKFCLSDEVEKVLGDDYSEIAKKASQRYFDAYLNRLSEKNINLVTCYDKEYPKKLLNLDDRPYYFYYMGNLDLLSKPCVAIVGTRTPSNYGITVTEKFAGALASAGAVIVSGLAYGVDSIAHREALKKGKTIAVLGSGFDHVYPAQHQSLFEQIASEGLVISEYRPDVKATKFTFPQRNRIVAALSDALVITEAGQKSGTIITKDFALDYGVPVYAVPGNITSEKSAGTNALISSMQGICLVDEKTILDDLKLEKKKAAPQQLSSSEGLLISALSGGELTIDEISEKSGINVKDLSSLLTTCEIKGIIKRLPGGLFTLG